MNKLTPRNEFVIPAPTGFSLQATVLSHGWHETSPMSWTETASCFQIIDRWADRAYRIGVRQERNRQSRNVLRAEILDVGQEPALRARAERILRTVLDLDRPVDEYHAFCSRDPQLAIIPRIGAGRLLRGPTMEENIIKALCATNVNWTQAVKMINRIGQLGPPVRHFVHLCAWPTCAEILRAGDPFLREVCRLGYRAPFILEFCENVKMKRLDPENFLVMAADPDVPTDTLAKSLRNIKGIGVSSTGFLLSLMGRFDRMSIDSATLAHVARVHLHGRKPKPKEVESLYAKYGKWKNLAWWHEHWLTWETGRRMAAESSTDSTVDSQTRVG